MSTKQETLNIETMKFTSKTKWSVTLLLQLTLAHVVMACTGIILRGEDGTTVAARTMEFSFDIQSNILIVPAGTEITTLSWDDANEGFTYKAKYGFGGANCLGKPVVVDGVNEMGLYFGAFYFAGSATFEKLSDENRAKAISSEELGNWILSQFASIKELKEALPQKVVVGTHIDVIDGFAPFHYTVTDSSGASVVIQYTKRGLTFFDNTVNAVTNDPTFDWHKTNLQNYVGLSPVNREEITVGKLKLRPFGQGTGLIGLPGDHSSPSRFVRAVAYANTVLPSANSAETVFNAFHILNNFDIPKGSIREASGDELTDYTVWTSAADTKNGIYYYKTYKTQAVESVNIRKAVADMKAPKVLVMESGFSVRDRTEEANSK
ncbi:MAG: choloylglycine hydrolase family protein [Rubritalea sp.]|uniref:choloylglycine hydrolase family protein n=1 Tax=Rubritalea sp. TaxID=2109375 RepID=UPI003242B6C2